MAELLLEVGCEELPATFVRKAYEDLRDSLSSLFAEAGILESEPMAMGTPRRLIVSFPNLKERQPDVSKEVRGPNLHGAYKDGEPTPALLGFCRGQSVDVSQVRQEGGYVWVTKTIPGRDTHELLAELLPQAIRGIAFEKSMRWGTSRMRFARPIRWILAAFDSKVVPFQIESVTSGDQSRGHRFYHPETFTAQSFQELLSVLRSRCVEPDPEARRERILTGARQVTTGKPDLPEALIEENVFLTEWPTAIEGAFRPEFQELPDPVLVTAMAKHEKSFPVRDNVGALTNRFISIRNSGQDETVRKGYEWVLNARFNDAKFFYEEDRKHTLADFLEQTSGILFQEKLGTIRQRADRLANLSTEIACATGANNEEVDLARQAGLYCKADLSTGLVSELASLQGIIGGEYARREGHPEAMCRAIATHYDLSKNRSAESVEGRTALRVLLADNLDKLAGYLGQGLEPTGSSDPFALRRAATTLIEVAWLWPGDFPSYTELLDLALQEYRRQGIELDRKAHASLAELFASRYEALLPNVRHDILDAALLIEHEGEVLKPRKVRTRIVSLEQLADDTTFIQTATRPLNIVAAAAKKGIAYEKENPLGKLDSTDLDSQEGEGLLHALQERQTALFTASDDGDAEQIVAQLRSLAAPINAFFEATMVMVEDERVRYARLSLLEAANQQLLSAGDFSKLVIEG